MPPGAGVAFRLAGYEVYRFGGYELTQKQNSAAMVQDFFAQLAEAHGEESDEKNLTLPVSPFLTLTGGRAARWRWSNLR